MKKSYLHRFFLLNLSFLLGLMAACPGNDYMPEYFPRDMSVSDNGGNDNPGGGAEDSENAPTGSCTVHLDSTICIVLSAETVKVGTEGKEPLCADIEPIPIEVVNGTNLVLRGSTFPDIPFEGHGLPAPIVINAKGATDGTENVGTGTIDAAGNIKIEGFSFYINALGMVGEVPELTFTTGLPDEVEGIDVAEGEPVSADGQVKLVTSTIVGHLFPAADEKLYGASLMAVFEGTISPPFSECKGEGSKPQSTFVTKLVVEENGGQTEAILPGSTRMELPEAFIAEGPADVGPDFESSAKFKIVNATSKPLKINISPLMGPFFIESAGGGNLQQELASKTPLVIKVTFRPSSGTVPKAGEVAEMLTIGSDVYQLVAEAKKSSGKIGMDVTDASGGASPSMDTLKVGNVMVSANLRKEFFSCSKIKCDGVEQPTSCVPCLDVLINVCQLLPVDNNGDPVGVVDAGCKPVNEGAKDLFSLGIHGNPVSPAKQVITIKNNGVKPLEIGSIKIEEYENSKSRGQFKVSVERALPSTLEPYKLSNSDTITAVVVYEPTDLSGADGSVASVGRPVKDRAALRVVSGEGSASVELQGITTVKETPALEVFIKSSTGTKRQLDGSEFAFRGVTMETADLAVPVFIKLSDSAAGSIRVLKISVDDAPFEWLDSREKISSKPEASRCTIPVFSSDGGLASSITDLNPASLLPNGFDLNPGAFTTDNMPFFGCVNFHMPSEKKRQSKSRLTISTVEIGRDGKPARNPDGSLKQTDFVVGLLAVINPIKGKVVFRLIQTMAAVMNPQYSSISAAASKKEMDWQIEDGISQERERFIMPGALILDPFDEDTIYDEQGNILSNPGDGVTAIYRKVDTHPVSDDYGETLLPDYTSLTFNAANGAGEKGVFFDFPNVPEDLKTGALRIYTASLSWPGPLAGPEERPETLSMCQEVDPCSEEGQRLHGEGPTDPSKRGVCAFFFASAGSWPSPSLHYSGEMEGGERRNLCKDVNKPQKLTDVTGDYNLNGSINFSDIGLRLWGPNYFNNPVSSLGGSYPPLDSVFHIAFTTNILMPPLKEGDSNVIPDQRVNISRMEHKINLTDTALETPRLCESAVKNRMIRGEYYSTWKYLAPLLVKDEGGTTPAGCPEPGNSFTGGSAFMRGRPLDHESGIITLVGVAKFESDNNLTFAFKDVILFLVLNGWICDPAGDPEKFEGAHCYDNNFNERDGLGAISIIE